MGRRKLKTARCGRFRISRSRRFLKVFQQNDADHHDRIARYPMPPGTGTGLFVPEFGKLFVAVRGEPNAEIRVYETNEAHKAAD
jgi:hypothetical protein